MAKNEIIFTKRSLPGVSTGIDKRISTETGQGEVFRQLGNLGAVLGDFGTKLYKLQGETELTQKMFDANEDFQKLELELLDESDPEQYLKKYEQYWSDIQSSEVKNGYARRRWKSALPTLRKSQMSSIANDFAKKVRDDHEMAIANMEAQYIQGKVSKEALVAMYKSEVEAFPDMTEDEISLRLTLADDKREKHLKAEKAELKSKQYQAALSFANTAPREMKEMTEEALNTGGKLSMFPDQEAGAIMALDNVALGAIRKQTENTFDNIITQFTSEQDFGTSLETLQTSIKQMEFPEFDDSVARKLKERIWAATKQRYTNGLYATGQADDPWIKTRDERIHLNTMFAIDTGTITTPQEIMKAMFPEGAEKLGPAFDVSAYSSLVSRLPETKNPALKTFLADQWRAEIKDIFSTEIVNKGKSNEFRKIPTENLGAAQKMLEQADSILLEHQDDPIAAQRKLESLVSSGKKEVTIGFLKSLRIAIKEGIFAEGPAHKARRFAKLAGSGEIVIIEHQHERDMLPSGAVYQIKGDDNIYTKE